MALKQMSGKEFVKKLLPPFEEKDFTRVKIEEGFDLSGYEGFKGMQSYLKSQDLKKTPLNISFSEFKYIKAKGLYLPYAIGKMVDFRGANLSKADLYGANFEKGCFNNANLEKVILEGANLYKASFDGANLEEANLRDACLKLASLFETNFVGANLDGADLEKTNLLKAFLYKANLDGANLVGANLEGSFLYKANLKRANLGGSNVEKAIALGLRLLKENFEGVELDKAFQGAPREPLEEKVQDAPRASFDGKVGRVFSGIIKIALACGLFFGGFYLVDKFKNEGDDIKTNIKMPSNEEKIIDKKVKQMDEYNSSIVDYEKENIRYVLQTEGFPYIKELTASRSYKSVNAFGVTISQCDFWASDLFIYYIEVIDDNNAMSNISYNYNISCSEVNFNKRRGRIGEWRSTVQEKMPRTSKATLRKIGGRWQID